MAYGCPYTQNDIQTDRKTRYQCPDTQKDKQIDRQKDGQTDYSNFNIDIRYLGVKI